MATYTIFGADVPSSPGVADGPAEVGTKFTTSAPGSVVALRYYRPAGATGAASGRLWTVAGALLGSVVYPEDVEGWHAVPLDSPVALTPGALYVVSYHAGDHYAASAYALLGGSVTSGPLTAPVTSDVGGNGVYAYGPAGTLPDQTFNGTAYYADVSFEEAATADALVATNLVGGPATFGTPAVGQVHVLSGLGVSGGSATFGTPALGQIHALSGLGVSGGPATLGTPALGQVHTLAATGLSTSAASLGAPALRQVHALVASPLVGGPAVLGRPALPGVSLPPLARPDVILRGEVASVAGLLGSVAGAVTIQAQVP